MKIKTPLFLAFATLLTGCNLTVINDGGGLVTSSSGLIRCGEKCSASYKETTLEVLTAIPDEGYEFAGWEGACKGSDTCEVSIGNNSGNKSVTAKFLPHYELTVNTPEYGKVTSNDNQIDCGSNCTAIYSENTSVTLTATPENEFKFSHWEGDCTGTRDCVIELNSVKSSANVSAVFSKLPDITSISTHENYTCVIKKGALDCFGYKPYGPGLPQNLGNVTQVAMGLGFTCAITDGDVSCWGDNNYKPNLPTDFMNPRDLSGDSEFVCVIDDSGLGCWGDNTYGRATPPPLSNPTKVTTGRKFGCAIADEGVVCWGDSPAISGTFSNPIAISAGYSHVCVLDDNGVRCFGLTANVPKLANPIDVVSGQHHSCAIADEGVRCWGSNSNGQTNVPTGLDTPYLISAGTAHTCVVDKSGVHCWGSNFSGQSLSATNLSNPTKIFMQDSYSKDAVCVKTDTSVNCFGEYSPTGSNIIEVGFGGEHNCKLASNGSSESTLSCEGSNLGGQLNLPLSTASQLAIGDYFSCAFSTSLGLRCSGYVRAGDITPPTLTNVSKIDAGYNTACALHSGRVSCWGYIFTWLPAFTRATDVSIGGDSHICVIEDGVLQCYISNPKIVAPSLTNVSRVALGSEHGCALVNGTVTCWGDDRFGQVRVPDDLTGVTQIDVTDSTSCALNNEGLTCWGKYNLSPRYTR